MKIDNLDLFFALFNIFLGVLSFMVSVGRIKLSKELTRKKILLFKICGILLVLGGISKIILAYGK